MKKGLLVSLVLSGILSGAVADDKDFNKRLKALESAMFDLKKENDTLKAMLKDKKTDEMIDEIGEVLDEVEDRLDGVETMALVDRVSFGLGVDTGVNIIDGESPNGTEFESGDVWTTKVMLNMNSQIADNLKFNGRLSMYRLWGDGGANVVNAMPGIQGRKPDDSKVYIERAYVDWRAIDGVVPVTLTLGRQPAGEGPSAHFKNNTVRKGTFSALVFDAAGDAIATTFNLEKLTGVKKTAFRAIYAKMFQDINPSTFVKATDNKIDDANFYGLFLDSSIPALGDNFLQLYGFTLTDLTANKALDKNGVDKNLGDINMVGALAEFRNIADSGLDFFIQGAISNTKPNGVVYKNDLNGDGVDEHYGLMSSQEGDKGSKTGHSIWGGVRYTIPAWVKPKIGFEYNYGSKNWVSLSQGSNDLTGKLLTRGSAYDLYYIQPINKFAYLRAGATYIDYEYSGSGSYIGGPLKLENNQMTGGIMSELTHYYLNFNLLY